MEIRIPRGDLVAMAEKWVNEHVMTPMRVTDVRLDEGCGMGDARRDLVIEVERGDEDHETGRARAEQR